MNYTHKILVDIGLKKAMKKGCKKKSKHGKKMLLIYDLLTISLVRNDSASISHY